MQALAQRITQANASIAPYAVPHQGILGRMHPEPEDETRFPFQRDRDRIIHTQSFRRLKGKTQVFVAGTHDHVRTRLTHTMEVAQISRDIARTLGLNEDLTECVALAHDLGHPPFGHAGEEVMDTWMQQHGSSFEHNEQSFRIVTLLEEHSSLYQGLNLNREILDGLRKHASPYDRFPAHSAPAPTLESQIVDLADEIAYSGHDCEDGLQAKLFSPTELRCVKIIAEALALAEHRGTSLRGALIHLLVLDLYQASEEKISSQRITTPDSIAHAGIPLICFSPPTREALNELRDFLWEHLYLHPRVCSANEEGKTIVSSLCASYLSAPPPKVLSLQEKTKGALYEAVKDYVAGMTDAYALEQARTRGIIRESAHPPPLGMEDS